jgi:hypothetical protein
MEQKLVEIRNSCLKYYKSVISDFSENIFEFDNFVKIEAHLLQILIPKLEASEDIFYHESEFYLNLIEYDELINKGADHYQDGLAEVQEFFEKTIEKSEIVDVLDFSKMNPNNPENLVYRGLQTFRIVDEAFFIEKLKSYGKTLIDTH